MKERQIFKQQRLHDDLKTAANFILQMAAEQAQIFMPNCVMTLVSKKDWVEKPLSWWQTQGCSGNFHEFQYYYMVTDMGVDACAFIGQKVANYYRLVAFVFLPSDVTQRLILASTIIKPVTATTICAAKTHSVFIGRQTQTEVF
jgi:hypothetical protein